MSANLSDRIIDSSKDVIQKILETDLVQKLLMTGDLSEGKNRAVAQRVFKNLSDLSGFSLKAYKDALKLSDLTPEEKAFFQKMDEQYTPVYSKYLEELKAVVGPVPDEVMSAPVRPMAAEYQKCFTDQIEKGSVIRVLVSSLVGYAIPVGIYNHLMSSPSYKENCLAKLLTFSTLGAEKALGAFKLLIDNRAKDVSPDLESELKDLFRSIAEFQLKVVITQYNEA